MKTKNRTEYQTTTNRSVYNKARKEYLSKQGEIHCNFCSYHKSENCTDKWYGTYLNSTKVRYPNWKLVSKNKKQWMKKEYKIRNRHIGYMDWVKIEI